MPKKLILTNETVNKIKKLYCDDNMSINNIASKMNISSTKIRHILLENNCQLRSGRRYTLNENYFDVIDTPDKAYIIGLLAADGSNDEKEGEIRLSLQKRDIDILNKINEQIGSNRPLSVRTFRKETWQDSYTLAINSHHMSKRLAQIGIVQKKSLILNFPSEIPDEFLPAMLRGYIDGDGWIQPHLIGLMSSDKFCYKTQEYLSEVLDISSTVMDMKRSYSVHTKTLYITGIKNILPFVYTIYELGDLCIERKKEHCIEYGFLLQPDNSLTA